MLEYVGAYGLYQNLGSRRRKLQLDGTESQIDLLEMYALMMCEMQTLAWCESSPAQKSGMSYVDQSEKNHRRLLQVRADMDTIKHKLLQQSLPRQWWPHIKKALKAGLHFSLGHFAFGALQREISKHMKRSEDQGDDYRDEDYRDEDYRDSQQENTKQDEEASRRKRHQDNQDFLHACNSSRGKSEECRARAMSTLGIGNDSQRAVKKAFREATLKYHPDRCKSAECEPAFHAAREAAEYLLDR